MGKTVSFTILLCLAATGVAATDADIIDDFELQRGAKSALLDWLAEPDHVPASVLIEQLDSRLHHPLALPSVTARGPEVPDVPAKVYRERRDSVVVLVYLYKCPRCHDWHLSTAGGVMLTVDGAGVTNYHVMAQNKEESKEVFGIVTFDGSFHPVVEILAASSADDLALFRVRGDGFSVAPLSVGDGPGEPVTAITHPSSNFFLVTTGVVARTAFDLDPGPGTGRPRMFVTADFARGSSGGGIFNARGELAAVASATRTLFASSDRSTERPVQMVLKKAIPAAAIRVLLTPEATEAESEPSPAPPGPSCCGLETVETPDETKR